MNKIIEREKGITIISLIVTIIILIILAGVSINMLLGENGIITKAKEAAKLQEIASLKEEIKLKILEQELEGKVTQLKIETILLEYGTVNKNEDGTIKSLTPTGKDYEIAYEDIYIGEIGEEGDNGGNTGDGTNNGSDSDTITLKKEEYDSIIARIETLEKKEDSLIKYNKNTDTVQIYYKGKWNDWKNANLQVVDLYLDKRKLGTPSNTSYTNSTVRTFDTNTYIVGCSGDNYYAESNITSYYVTETEISVSSVSSGYGIGIPILLIPGETYEVSASEIINGTVVSLSFYNSSGTFLSYTNVKQGGTTTIPSSAYYTVIVIPGTANQTITVKNLKIKQI